MKPVLQALLVADHIYTDKATGKKIVAGIFHRLWFQKHETPQVTGGTPGEAPKEIKISISPGGMSVGSPFCYISLTEVLGAKEFQLRYVNLKNDLAIFSTTFRVTCSDPIETVEIIIPLPPLPAHEAGRFAFELVCDNEPLGSYRISVDELNEENTNGN